MALLESIKQAKIGSMVPVSKEIDKVDALEVFSKASNFGKKKNSLVIEGQKETIVCTQPCIVVTGKGSEFEIKALNENGRRFLHFLKRDFSFCDKVTYGREKIVGTLIPPKRAVSEDHRLRLKSHMDIIKVVACTFKPIWHVHSGLYGMVSHDFFGNSIFEGKKDKGDDPDYVLYFVDNMILTNHNSEKSHIIANALITDTKRGKIYDGCKKTISSYEKQAAKKDMKVKKRKKRELQGECESDEQFLRAVRNVKKHVNNGDILFKALFRKAVCNFDAEPLNLYAQFKQKSANNFFMSDEDGAVAGSSCGSEFVLSAHEGVLLKIATQKSPRPITGGKLDYDLDNKFEMNMKYDGLELTKHVMFLDMARNEVARVSESGTRYADKLCTIESNEQKHSCISTVKGSLRKDVDLMHAFGSLLNFDVGLPKIPATKLEKSMGLCSGYFVKITPDMLVGNVVRPIRIKKGKIHFGVASLVLDKTEEEKAVKESSNEINSMFDILKSAGR